MGLFILVVASLLVVSLLVVSLLAVISVPLVISTNFYISNYGPGLGQIYISGTPAGNSPPSLANYLVCGYVHLLRNSSINIFRKYIGERYVRSG
jgi:hypothetical protein